MDDEDDGVDADGRGGWEKGMLAYDIQGTDKKTGGGKKA